MKAMKTTAMKTMKAPKTRKAMKAMKVTKMAMEAFGQIWSPAEKGSNILRDLAVSDKYQNVIRIKSLIKELDSMINKPRSCNNQSR